MKRIALALVITALLQAAGSVGTAQDDGKSMDGVWLPVEAEFAGEMFPDKVLKTLKLTMKDGKYTVNVGDAVDKGDVKLDQAAKPKSMVITGTDGPSKGKTILAIYEWNGDSLRVCYDLEGINRPTAFKTEKDSKLFLVTYKREKR